MAIQQEETLTMRKMIRTMIATTVAVLLVAATAQAATYTVDQGGAGDFTTIGAAITTAIDGDTINVNAGTYDEAITINEAISLIGVAGAGSTTLTYTNTSALRSQLIMLGANTGLTIGGAVTIDGFTLKHDVGLYDDNNLIKFRADTSSGLITIQNNVFDQNGTDITAIEEAYGSANFLIQDNQFNSRYGIWLNEAHDGTITGNTLTGSRIGMGGSGGVGNNPRDLVVSENTIDGATYGMVLANNIENIDFLGNTITNCTAAGVLYWEYGTYLRWNDVTFTCNKLIGNAEGIVGYYDPNATLPTLVDGENNYWGAADGPSGLGPGSGDTVQVYNFDYDPWRTTPDCTTVIPLPAAAWMGFVLLGGLGGLNVLRRRRS